MRLSPRSLLATGFFLALGGCGPDATAPTAPVFSVTVTSKPVVGSTATMQVSGCEFTVNYSWSGLHGRDLTATYGLYERSNGLDISFDLWNEDGQLGKSGAVSHKFVLGANATSGRTIVGRGELSDNRTFQQVKGSSAASGTVFSTCG